MDIASSTLKFSFLSFKKLYYHREKQLVDIVLYGQMDDV
jgi:hypothetical protein